MDIINRAVNGKHFEFDCEYRDARDGFNHFVRLYMNDELIAEEKRHYINRTWEAYRYQSAMIGAVNNALAYEKARVREEYLHENNYKIVTEKRRDGLEEKYKTDPMVRDLEELNNRIRNDRYGSEKEREELESLDRLLKMTEALAQMGAFRNN